MPFTLNTKIYNGAGLANGVARYVERSAGVASGFSNLTSSLKIDSKVRGVIKIDLPEITTESSACACPGDILRMSGVDISIRLDPKAPAATRTDLRLRLKDLIASAQFIAWFDNLEPMTGA